MHALVCPLCRIALPPVADICPRDGQPGRETRWLAIPAPLTHRFQLLEPFASGATGSLYLVDEPATGRRGLLKILGPVSLEQLPERHRLRRELIKQATLERGNVVTPLASGEADGATWIFREWLDGVTLDVRLSREGALQQTEALAIAAQIASALDQLHRGGLLHRDVKPGHIFLQTTAHGLPRALLLDAGITGTIPARGVGPLYGTAGYTAPEQLIGKLASFRSDLYSLGCVLYRMLTGRPAFAGEALDDTLTAQRYGELPAMPSHLPNGIGALLRSLLAKDPQERPFSAQKLRRTLDPFLPDGALMEKQPTTTFETLPEPGPSTTPQPSGTLRPPAPSVHPSLPAPASGLATPPSDASTPAEASAPAPRKEKKREGTERIDIEDLQELDPDDLTPVPKRPTSVPPPVPPAGVGKGRSQPPSRAPIPPSEKTQPIRLDQILSIAASRALTQPPPTPPEEERPRSVAPAAAAIPPPAPIPMTEHSSAELDALLASDDSGIETLVTAPSTPAASAVKATLLGIGADPMEPAPALPLGTAPAFTAPEPPALAERDAPTLPRPVGPPISSDEDAAPEATIPLTGRAFALPASLRSDPRKWLIYASAALVGLSALGVGASALLGSSEQPVAKKEANAPTPPALPAVSAAPQPRVEPLPTTTEVRPTTTANAAGNTAASGASTKATADTAAAERAEAERAEAERAEAERQAAEAAKRAEAERQAAEREAAKRAEAERKAAEREAAREAAAREAAERKAAAAAAREAAAAERKTAAAARKEERARQRAARAEARAARKLARAEAKRERDEAKRVERERAKSAKSSPAEKSGDKAALFADARDEARAHYTAKRYKEAAAAYERAARYDPSNPGTFAGLGAARLHLGDHRAAVQAYQRAVKLSPDSAGFQYALGRAHFASGEKSKAKAAYKRALAIDPKNEAAKTALTQLGG